MTCEACGHADPHTGGGLGICLHAGCPCDGSMETLAETARRLHAEFPEGIGAPWLSTPRSADRIGRICEKLALVWSQNPDQRLGQLLSNYAFGHHVDIWHQEDTDTEANLDAFLSAPVEQRQCPHPGVMRGEVCPKCGGTFG